MIDMEYLDPDKVYEMTGYRPFTTFWSDFAIAEKFGKDAIIDTYNRTFKGWKDQCDYMTELALILNWKSWHFADLINQADDPDLIEKFKSYSKLYIDLWQKTDQYCLDNFKGDELNYYLEAID